MKLVLNQRSYLGIAVFIALAAPLIFFGSYIKILTSLRDPFATEARQFAENLKNTQDQETKDALRKEFFEKSGNIAKTQQNRIIYTFVILIISAILLLSVAFYFVPNLLIKNGLLMAIYWLILMCIQAIYPAKWLLLVLVILPAVVAAFYRNKAFFSAYLQVFAAWLLTILFFALVIFSCVSLGISQSNSKINKRINEEKLADQNNDYLPIYKEEIAAVATPIGYAAIAFAFALLVASCFVTNSILSVAIIYSAFNLIAIIASLFLMLTRYFQEDVMRLFIVTNGLFFVAFAAALLFIFAQNQFLARIRNRA